MINAYEPNECFESLKETIKNLKDNYNVVVTSLGPKPSSVALFDIQNIYPEVALCYVPSLKYNTLDYSEDLEEQIEI